MRRRFGSSRTTPPPIASSAERGSRAGRRDHAQAAYRKRLVVAARTGDVQTKKEIEVFPYLDTARS
jgi:hypothetical protein